MPGGSSRDLDQSNDRTNRSRACLLTSMRRWIQWLLRVASLAFVLRAGVNCTNSGPQDTARFRTVQATVDTILYQRLQMAEKALFTMLQRLVFRSAGYLSREQIYPVALVFWQLLRILCIGASHLSNIVQRFKSKGIAHYLPSPFSSSVLLASKSFFRLTNNNLNIAFGQADYQYLALKLVLSTHLALFRSSNPLLLDFNDKFNQDLLGGDKHLITLAMKMREVVISFREKGFAELRGSIAYRKEFFDLFRNVYDGL